MCKKYLLIGFCLWTTTVHPETISLEYKGFYDRLKQVNKGGYQLVEVAFSVPMRPNCHIQKGTISSEKNSTPLVYTNTQRLFIPFDGVLKEQRALVNLTFDGTADGCAIAMQVRARRTQTEYDKAQLQQLISEMDSLLGAMQGFPTRYFREPITGLNFEFDPEQEVIALVDGREQQIKGSFKLTSAELELLNSLSFNLPPTVLSPWVK